VKKKIRVEYHVRGHAQKACRTELTAGFPFSTEIEVPTRDLLPLAVAARDYATVPLLSEPGTKYLYSNAGINTAGRIVELVSNMPFEEFLQRRLFDPLEMRDTTFFPSASQLTRLTKTYKPASKEGGLVETTAGQLHYPLDDPRRKPMPGGGLFATARDCASFCRMILAGGERDGQRIISRESIDAMGRRQTPETVKESYGLGWQVYGADTFGHGGAFATNMTIDRPRGLAYVYMVQHAGFHENVGGKILEAFHTAAKERFGK
jgi:CubicO group peptidase (beta-lactamase class C family)